MLLFLLVSAAVAQTFPPLTVTTLSGRAVSVPRDLGTGNRVVLLAFARAHQTDFDAWRPLLVSERGGSTNPALDWVEIPFVDVPALLKPVINGAMRRSLSDPLARDHFAPLFASGNPVRQACQIPTDAHMVLLLLDPSGAIRFRWSGPPGENGLGALQAALAGAY